jgi:MarR family transcriptional regulator, negative regulator of the multidrug operon emrRAB
MRYSLTDHVSLVIIAPHLHPRRTPITVPTPVAAPAIEYQARMSQVLASLAPDRDAADALAVWRLVRAASLAERLVEATVHRPRGRTWASFRLLVALRAIGPTEPGTLADILDIAPPSVSSLLATLERAGHITRRPDPSNRRRVIVELTASGSEAVTESMSAQFDGESAVLSGLAADEVATLSSILDKLLKLRWADPS